MRCATISCNCQSPRSWMPRSSRCATVLSRYSAPRAEIAAGHGEVVGDLLLRQPAAIVEAPAVEHEGEGPHALGLAAGARGVDMQPAREIGRLALERLDGQFAAQQALDLRLQHVALDAVEHAPALAAPVEAQHQAGLRVCAAPARQPHAERAVPAPGGADALLGMVDSRLPDQRAIGEDPGVPPRLVPRQHHAQMLQVVVVAGIAELRIGAGVRDLPVNPRHMLRRQRYQPRAASHSTLPRPWRDGGETTMDGGIIPSACTSSYENF